MDSFNIPLSLTSRSFASADSQQQQLQPQDVNEQSKTNEDNDNSNHALPVKKDDYKMVLDQMCCAICLDILVNPQTIVPCGHTYCGSCLTEIDNDHCPECRGSISSRVPALQLKGLIESLVEQQVPHKLNPSDIEHYQERKKTDQSQRYQCSIIGRPKKRSRNVSLRSTAAETATSGAVIGAAVHRASTAYTRQGRGSSHRSRRAWSSRFLSMLEPMNASELESLWDMPLPDLDDSMENVVASSAGQPQQQLLGTQGRSADDAICLD